MNLKIKEIRKSSRISQTDLASRIGVSLRTVGAWERGETIPDAEQVWNCAEALGCTPNDILGWSESHKDSEQTFGDPRQKALNGHYDSLNESSKDDLVGFAKSFASDPERRIKKDGDEPASYKPAMGA